MRLTLQIQPRRRALSKAPEDDCSCRYYRSCCSVRAEKAETFSGRIRSDFGTVEEPEHGPGRSLDATIGDGNTRVNIETFSGDITIRRD